MTANETAVTPDACWKNIGIWGDGSCPQLVAHTHCRNCEVYHAAAARLLDRPPPPGYREEWTARIAQPRQPKLSGTHSIVIFRAGEEWLALPTSLFSEVADLRPIHSLPHRGKSAVQGLVNIRGELLVCISLPGLLGFEAAAPAKRAGGGTIYRRLLVVADKNSRVVFPVDEVHVGCRYHPGELKSPPATVDRAASKYTLGLFQWKEYNVGVLDKERLFYTLNRTLA